MARVLDGRFRIRQAAIEDLPDLARMKNLAWRQAYDLPEDVFAAMEARVDRTAEFWQDTARRGGYFWAVVDTATEPPELVGIAHATHAREADAPASLELAMIYLLDQAKGSGIADRLVQMTIGDAPAYLWVLADNARAIAFYRRHGFRPDGAERLCEGSLTGLLELRMSRPGT